MFWSLTRADLWLTFAPNYHPRELWFTVITWHAVLHQVLMKRSMHFSIDVICVETSLLRGKLDNTLAAQTINLTAPLKIYHLFYLQSTIWKWSNAIVFHLFPISTTTKQSSVAVSCFNFGDCLLPSLPQWQIDSVSSSLWIGKRRVGWNVWYSYG